VKDLGKKDRRETFVYSTAQQRTKVGRRAQIAKIFDHLGKGKGGIMLMNGDRKARGHNLSCSRGKLKEKEENSRNKGKKVSLRKVDVARIFSLATCYTNRLVRFKLNEYGKKAGGVRRRNFFLLVAGTHYLS